MQKNINGENFKGRRGDGRDYLKRVISVIKHAENYLLVSFIQRGIFYAVCLNLGFIVENK